MFIGWAKATPAPRNGNRISAYIWNAAGGEGAGAYFQDELTPGRWIHVVACYDPGDQTDPFAGVTIYRDGILRAGPRHSRGARYASYGIAATHGASPLRSGTRDLQSFFTGALDDVAVYPRVLSAAEVAQNFSAAG
jgi:Concanavalin A-like lectin/glucanases superfamily